MKRTKDSTISVAAATLGQRGGKARTLAKRRAVRRNLAKANQAKAANRETVTHWVHLSVTIPYGTAVDIGQWVLDAIEDFQCHTGQHVNAKIMKVE